MQELFDEDFDSIELVEGALILNEAINPETQVHWAHQELSRLLKEAELALVAERLEQTRFEGLLRLFYSDWGFQGDKESYFHSNNGFVDQVLERRKGIPVSLGAILMYVARHLGFRVHGIAFPTQFVLRIDWQDGQHSYLNPFNGEYVTTHTMRAWLVGHDGPLAKISAADLEVTDNATVIGRWLALLKSALLREESYALALRCTDLALTFVPDDPYEIRDRGFIYQQLECHNVALNDYQFFIDQCPEDPAAELLKTQVNLMSRKEVVLH
ncbi:SirB1 family protein [Vibrio agarivorans]|uniref:SirB1 family protein n=1 Tax=Vibrio agarivorans TaxID=153622 RepID=UPI0022311193|nr:SirB1 family protein [Vibrio agarivorans]